MTTVLEKAQNLALGQFLSSWGHLSYEEVLQALYAFDTVLPEELIIWGSLDNYSTTEVGEKIEDLYELLKALVESAFTAGKESK